MTLRPIAVPILILTTVPAFADNLLPAVTVTAKGYAADELETPAAVLTLSREELLRRGANNPGEALRGEPGLAVSSDSAQGQNPVIRGLKKESVVLQVDGIRLNAAQPSGAIASFMSLGLAERLEVVRGPAPVLHGTGALGGVINVLLPQARFVPGIQGRGAMIFDRASEGLRGTAVVNASGGDHAMMVGASVARIGDYSEPNGKVDRTGYGSDSIIGQYRFRLDAANQLRASLQRHTDKDVWYPGSTRPNPNQQVQSTTVHSPKQERVLAEVGYSRKGSGDAPVNLDLRGYRQEMKREIFSFANGPLRRDIAESRVNFATVGADARADWLAHPQHLVSLGVNTWRTEASPERLLPTPANNPANPLARNDPFRNGSFQALGFYLQDDRRFGKLGVLAGVRRDSVKGEADAVGTVTQNLARTDNLWSGSFATIYEVSPLLRPYANFSRGVRAGEMRERFEASPRSDGFFYAGNPQIKPETATQFELGLKGAHRDLDYRVAAYRTRIADFITGLDISGTAGAAAACGAANVAACKRTVNLGYATLEGIEASASWQFVASQWVRLGLSRVRGRNEDLGEPLFQMPADEASLGWEGRVAAGWIADATLRLVRKQDRVATVFARGAENATPGFAIADVGATWTGRGQRVRVALKNAFDRRYREHLTEGVSGSEPKAPGRNLALTWECEF